PLPPLKPAACHPERNETRCRKAPGFLFGHLRSLTTRMPIWQAGHRVVSCHRTHTPSDIAFAGVGVEGVRRTWLTANKAGNTCSAHCWRAGACVPGVTVQRVAGFIPAVIRQRLESEASPGVLTPGRSAPAIPPKANPHPSPAPWGPGRTTSD